jgi:hypothetical protein
MKLAILIPSGFQWFAGFGYCLANLTKHSQGDVFNLQGSNLLYLRETLLDMAKDYDYALCLDSDMLFPPDTVDRLVKHEKDIVCANYVTKKTSARWLALGLDGQVCDSREKSGIEEVGRIPFGVTLIKMSAIKDIPSPRFLFPWNAATGRAGGEDYYFSDLCRQHGLKIYVDHDLTKEVMHMGTALYNHSHVTG